MNVRFVVPELLCGLGAYLTVQVVELLYVIVYLEMTQTLEPQENVIMHGAVTAHSVGVVSTNNTDCYISQLNVMSTTYFTEFGMKNKTVTCLYVIGTNETVVDTRRFMFITVRYNNNYYCYY